MWRISALLWSAVEWGEHQAEKRRLLYCHRHLLRSDPESPPGTHTMHARLRAACVFVLMLFIQRR